MIIEATYEQGAIRLPSGLTFRHDYFKVKIEVPEQELITEVEHTLQISSELEQRYQETGIRQRIDAILAPYQELLAQGQSFTPQDYKEMRHQHLEEKYLGR